MSTPKTKITNRLDTHKITYRVLSHSEPVFTVEAAAKQRAAKALISERAVYTPEELHVKLSPESAMVMYQHNPPFWSPPKNVKTPMLWLAGEEDAVIGEAAERRSAAYYKADYVVVEKAGHNLMMEHNYRQTAEIIHNWLIKQGIG